MIRTATESIDGLFENYTLLGSLLLSRQIDNAAECGVVHLDQICGDSVMCAKSHLHTGMALVYPYIAFHDEDWLKQSLLYWDGIRRIVPDGHVTHDSGPVGTLIQEGIVKNTSPTPYLGGTAERLRRHCGLDGGTTIENFQRTTGLTSEHAHFTFRIHAEKMDPVLVEDLRKTQCIEVHGQWLSLNSEFGNYYMSCLGAEMAESIKCDLTTDSALTANLGRFFAFADPENVQRGIGHEDSILASLGIELPCPKSLWKVEWDTILRFREDHQAERVALREAVQDVEEKVAGLEDPNAIEDLMAQEKNRIATLLADQKKAIDELNVETTVSCLDLKAPTLMTVAGAAISPLNAGVGLVLAGTGLVFKAIQWYATRRGAKRRLVRANPWHYALTLGQGFATG